MSAAAPARTHIPRYLGALRSGEAGLADALTAAATRHEGDPDLRDGARRQAARARTRVEGLATWIARFGVSANADPERLRAALFQDGRVGGLGLLRDLQDLELLVAQLRSAWTVLAQVARELHDAAMEAWADAGRFEIERAQLWLDTLVKNTAPQAVIVVAEPDGSR